VPRQRVQASAERGWLEVLGASENNLQSIDARIPLGTLTCVTAERFGKSTLVDDILRRALFRKFFGSKDRPGTHRVLKGFETWTRYRHRPDPIGRRRAASRHLHRHVQSYPRPLCPAARRADPRL